MKNKKLKKITLQIPQHVFDSIAESYENDKDILGVLVKNEDQAVDEVFQSGLRKFYKKDKSLFAVYFSGR